MKPLLYGELVPWYWLVDPTADHWDEAAAYEKAILSVAPDAKTLLELGAGAGNNASFLKERFECTLSDPSEPMQTLSRQLNPECEHVDGEMRSVRLGRAFDAVFVHDAIMYMTSEADLLAVARTAFEHTRPGGAAVFAPDCTRETFRESTNLLEGENERRALRGIEWKWDPEPKDETFWVEYAFLLREGETVRAVHDRHLHGLFPAAVWKRVLASVGYEVGTFARPFDDNETDELFVCRRPD